MGWSAKNKDANYLCMQKSDLTPPYDSSNGGGCNSSSPNSGLKIFTFATLYNNFICISMYVSLEMIYLCQAYFLENDLKLYDEGTDTPAECHTSGMCADIGQVQYILSDKTGTLTKNNMTLRRCSVAGIIYGAPIKPPTVQVDKEDIIDDDDMLGSDLITSPMQSDAVMPSGIKLTVVKKESPVPNEYFELEDMAVHRLKHPNNSSSDIVSEYLWNLAVCNTVMLMPDAKTGKLNINDIASLQKCLNAESPDEVALVLAAAQYGNELLINKDISE